jgi:predicted permease
MRLWAEIRERVGALLFRSADERAMVEEMRFHVEMETEKLIRSGLSPAEARRRARLSFGGVERYREETRDERGVGAIEDGARDVRQAWRRLSREPAFSVPVTASIALGVGVAVAIFALVNSVMLRPLPYAEPERLVTLTHSSAGVEFPVSGVSTGTFLHYLKHNQVFEGIGVYTERDRPLTGAEGAPEQVRAADVSPGLLRVLRARPHLGRLLIDEDAVPGTRSGIVISHDLWVRRYGADAGIVGRNIEIERDTREVLGVMERGFHFPDPETHVWYTSWRRDSVADLGTFYMNAVARLRPGVTIEEAEADLARLVRSLPDAYPSVTAARLEEMRLAAEVSPLKESVIGEEVSAALLLLVGMGGFLLLITWANATNLCLVRAQRQRKEVAVARALGARSVHLLRRFLADGIGLAGAGVAVGLWLAYLAIRMRFGFEPKAIPRLHELEMDGTVVLFAIGLALITAPLLGGASYLSAGRTRSAGALTGSFTRMTAGRHEQLVRRVLVAGQLALSLTLLIGSALMAGSFWRLSHVDLGFEATGAITFLLPTPPNAYGGNYYHTQVRLHDELLHELRAIPGVDAAEAANQSGFPLTPVPSYYELPVATAERADASRIWPHALIGFATPGYFHAMGIPILQGRTFRPEDTGREGHGVVLSRSLARSLFGDGDPIGRSVRWGHPSEDPDYTVIGVAGDVPSETIRQGPSRVLYFPNLHPPRADTITGVVHIYVPSDEMYVVRTSLPPASVLPAIREAVDRVDPKLVMTQPGTLDALVAESMARTRLTMLLLLIGAATALMLSIIGVYGVLSFTVGQQTSEFGVRLALGAEPARLVRMVVRQGAVLAACGVAIGLPAGLGLSRFLNVLLYDVSPSDPTAFIGMAAVLFLVALAASYIPARRAGAIDPARALRSN